MERHRRSCYGGDRFLSMDNFHSSCLLQHAELLSTRPLPIHSSQQHGVASSCPWKTPQMVLLHSASGETLPCEQLSSARPRVDFWQIPKGEFPASSTWCVCVHTQSLQACPTLWAPMDCSPPGSSVHGILQTRILEWVAMPFSGASPPPSDQTHVSCGCCTAGWFFTSEPPGKPRHWCGISWILFRVNLFQHHLDLSLEGWELFLGFLFQPQS